MIYLKTLLLCICLVWPSLASADANVHEWMGTWEMNHDGWKGNLIISDSKMDCATSPWCHIVLRYIDGKGNKLSGKIHTIDQKNQHMTFFINFPNNSQKFDSYLFSWDKTKMAGVTYWGGRTFGLFATKQQINETLEHHFSCPFSLFAGKHPNLQLATKHGGSKWIFLLFKST